jgi:Flp pilus assembly pilin Flp
MPHQNFYVLSQMRIALRYGRHAAGQCSLRVGNRLRREQTGQDVLEYAGMIVLIAIVIGLLFSLNIPSTVATAVAHAVNSIVSNGSSSYVPPSAIPNPPKS